MTSTQRNLRGGALAVLVSACMLLCVLSPAIINWNEEDSYAEIHNEGIDNDVFNYLALGDSMVNGFGMFGYYPNDEVNWNGFNMLVPNAFPAKLTKYLEEELDTEVQLLQLAVSAMRSAELRAILDPTFTGDEYTQRLINNSSGDFNETVEGIPKGYTQDVAGLREYYTDCIEAAELISYCFHYDFGYTLTQDVIMAFINYREVNDIDFSVYIDEEYIQMFEQFKLVIGEYVYALLEEQGIDIEGFKPMLEFVEGIIKGLVYVTLSYCINFDKNMELIYELNPNAEVIVIDSYNTFKGMYMTVEGIQVPLGDIYGFVLNLSNIYAKYLSKYSVTTCHISIDEYPTLFTDKFKNVDLENPDLTDQDKAVFMKALYHTIGPEDPNVSESFAKDYDFIDGYTYIDGNKVPISTFPGTEIPIVQDNLTKFLKIVFSSCELDWVYFTQEFEKAKEMLTKSVPKIFPDVESGYLGYLLTGTVTMNDDGSCTVASPVYATDGFEGSITLSKGDLSMLWMNFYVMVSGAVMSHPSIEGHQYIYDCIIDGIDFLDEMDYDYYEGDVEYLTTADGPYEDARLLEIAEDLMSDEIFETYFRDTTVVVAEVNNGNLLALVEDIYNYFDDPEYELEYFQISAMIAEKIDAVLLQLESDLVACFDELLEQYDSLDKFLIALDEKLNKMLNDALGYFIPAHQEYFGNLIDSIIADSIPIFIELYEKGILDEETVKEVFNNIIGAIENFCTTHPQVFMGLIINSRTVLAESVSAFIDENREMIEAIIASIDIPALFDALEMAGYEILEKIDVLIFIVERFIDSQISMYLGMPVLVDVVKVLNPYITTLYAGMYNPLAGVTLDINGTIVPIGMIMDLYVNMSNYAIKEVCDSIDDCVFVNVAGYSETFEPAEFVIELADISTGVGLAQRIEMDKAYLEDKVNTILENMVEIPLYDTFWVYDDGTVIKEVYNLEGNYLPVDAYTGSDPVKEETDDAYYTFVGWKEKLSGHAMTYVAEFTETTKKPIIDVEGSQAIVDVESTFTDPKANGVIVKVDDISVSIPKDLLVGYETATVTAKFVEKNDLPGSIQAFASDKKVISLEMLLDGNKVSSFGDQKVTVSFDYALAEGEDASTLAVWYMNETTMALEPVEFSYENGVLKVTMDHFSYWMVGHTEETDGEGDGGFPIAAIVAIVVIAGLCAVILRLRK